MGRVMKLREAVRNYADTPLVWLFFLSTFGFYMSIGVVSPLLIEHPILFGTMTMLGPWVPIIWGLIGLASLAVAVVAIYYHNKLLTKIFSTVQVILWVYAGAAYLQSGIFMLFVAVALPHVLFWAWNYTVRYDQAFKS